MRLMNFAPADIGLDDPHWGVSADFGESIHLRIEIAMRFLGLVKRETGFEIEIISGEEEARRTMLGIRSGLPAGVTDMLALDIGGGSTEFILAWPGQPMLARSIDIGVVRLSERILHADPPTADEVRQAREWVRNETQAAVADMTLPTGLTFVGTAGTITS